MLIYIKPDEEITSVIDKLVKTKDKEVFLVVPKAAVLAQSSVNLKLLKREANNLGKKITIVSQDPALRRLAEKNDFLVSVSLPTEDRDDDENDNDDDKDDDNNDDDNHDNNKEDEPILHEQISEDKFDDFLREEKKPSPLRIADIVKGAAPKGKLLIKKASEAETKTKKSDESEIQDLSKKEIPVFLGLEDSGQKLFATKEDKGSVSSDQSYLNPKYDFLKPREKARADFVRPPEEKKSANLARPSFFSFPGKIFALFISSALIIAALVTFFVLPKAEVSLLAKREVLPVDMKVLVDKNLAQPDFDGAKIPGQLIKLEEKSLPEFEATGQRQLNEKAKGTITVYNAYSSAPQTLVEATRFLSPQGLIFRLTKTVTIPGAKIEEGQIVPNSIDVLVEADQPGSQYNIGPVNFTIPGFAGSPKHEGFYGKSKNDMSGGSTENVRVLTQDDFDKAKAQGWENLKEKLNTQIKSQIPQGFLLLDEAVSVELVSVQPSVKVGQAAEKFSLSFKGAAKAMIFGEENISLLIKNKLIPDSDQKDFSDKKTLVYENVKADLEKGQLSFRAEGEQEVFWKVNGDELKNLIAGKGEKEVREIFSGRPEILEAQFSLWPFWVKKIPLQKEKISISIE